MPVCLVDIGNSSTQWCVYDKGLYRDYHAMPTSVFLSAQLPQPPAITRYIIASVVPDKDALFTGLNTLFITADIITDLTITLPNPQEIGADRLATAVGGYYLAQKKACMIIDSGTATTVCYINRHGQYQGGAIMPGLTIAAQALHDYTAKLPVIWVNPTHAYYGTTTESAIQVGLYRSAVYALNGFIRAYKHDNPDSRCIGTGTGVASMRDDLALDYFEPHLIFHGLARIAQLD